MYLWLDWDTTKGRCFAPLWNYCRKVYKGYDDSMRSSGTEQRVDNLAVANPRFYLLSCIAAIVGLFALSVFPKDTTAIRPVWESYQQPYDYYSAS